MNKGDKIDLCDVLSSQTLSDVSGFKIGDDLKDTLKINLKRVNKNTNDFFTSTFIIFNYVKYMNETHLNSQSSKDDYLNLARELLRELNECGFFVGDEWRDNNKLPYSKGNKKLSTDTVIFNLSPASLCISKNKGLCRVCGICYALSSERRYINTLIYRLTQLIRFDELSADEIASQFKNFRVFKYIRINESGDIFDMDDVLKLKEIARICYEKKGVYTYLYTARRDMWDEIKSHQTHYFKINRSGKDYNASPKISSNHKTLFCDGECNDCIFCKIELNTPITSLYHGDLIGDDLRDDKTKERDMEIKRVSFEMFESESNVDEIVDYIHKSLHIKGDD